MATKLRNLATSGITKTILWVLFITLCFFTCKGFVSIYRTAEQNSLPVESLNEFDYKSSYDFMLSQQDITAALYWKYDISKLYNIENIPTLYYRAEHQDGTVTTNVSGKDAEFFKSHKVYGIYKVLANGEWQDVSISNERRKQPYTIEYKRAWVFSDDQHSYPRNYSKKYTVDSVDGKNSFALPLPADIPSTVEWQIYDDGQERYETRSYTNAFGVTIIENRTPLTRDTSKDAVMMDGGNYVDISQFTDQQLEAEYQQWLSENPVPTATIYYAFDDDSLALYEQYWGQCRNYFLAQFGILLGIALAMLIVAIWLLTVSGRRPADTELHLLPTERIWTEVTLGAGFFAVFSGVALLIVGMDSMVYNQLYNDTIILNLYCIGLAVISVIILAIAMSLVRLLKAKRLIRNSLTYKVCYRCWQLFKRAINAFRGCFDERSFKGYPLTKALQRRQIVYFGALGGVLALILFFMMLDGGEASVFLSIILIAVLVGISYWHVKGNIKTYQEINEGFNESFDEQMKSERTKTALITNVSHDLKTPLTSIITYVDLLSKEELPDSARDYVSVLAQKSERLKSIVADLFDLSKSASGNIPLDMETLDFKRLIDQTLADMHDNIDESGLIIKTKLPDGEVNIYSDGKKLYRVFQNIIDNALKYSMAGTRVFITLEVESGMAVATVKNTAAYEMDFTADDVLQRFARGDKSRTSDGSGLGLSIAESFTSACGGSFKVELDGDLFKVTIKFAVK